MEHQQWITAQPQMQFGNLCITPEEVGTGFFPKALQPEPGVLEIGQRLRREQSLFSGGTVSATAIPSSESGSGIFLL
jgi:hypothetical protein